MQVSSGIDLRYLKQYRENFQGLTPASWTQAMSAFYAYRLPAGLEKAVLPVLLVAGAHESGDVWPTNRLLNRVLPNSCSVVVGDGGRMPAVQEHNWPVNSPGLCAEVIRAWAIKQQLVPGLAEVDTG
jgi:hypothetical protein